MVKAIFFDIDGTLVSFKTHEVPRSTIDALDILRKKGIKVFIATGRHYSSINNLGDLKFDGYVTLNGGYCFAGEDKVIYKHSIPDRDIDALIRYLETEESFPCAFVQEKEIFMNYKDETVEEIFNMLNFPEPPIRPLSEMKGKRTGEKDHVYLIPLRIHSLESVVYRCGTCREQQADRY